MKSASPHPELRPDPRRPVLDHEHGAEEGDVEGDDTALLRLVGAVATALVALAVAGSLMP
jgi:hypothetical protein